MLVRESPWLTSILFVPNTPIGIKCPANYTPVIKYPNAQGKIQDHLREAGAEVNTKYGRPPNLVVVILPEGGNDIYTAVKQYGYLSTVKFMI